MFSKRQLIIIERMVVTFLLVLLTSTIKAFDNVDYWLLFCKLLDNSTDVSCNLATRLLAYWYSNQIMCVRWQNTESQYFKIANGVRQGGILSPFLFRFYIRDLIHRVTKSGICCNYKGIPITLLACADDIVLLAPSWRALQDLDCTGS